MQQPQDPSQRQSPVPPVVAVLLAINIGMFLLQLSGLDQLLVKHLALWPPAPRGSRFELWQFLSYSVLHGSPAHLFFNMFALWMFGRHIERLWGSTPFLIFYVVCVAGAAAVQLGVTAAGFQGPYAQPVIGASGGVFGLLLAFGLMYPDEIIMLLIPPIPVRARYFVIIYGALELWLGVTGSGSKVAHFAHLGGMLFGYLLIQYWRGRLPWKPRRILYR